jgi:RNA polymerase sigma factor (sigma-70 family)
MDASLHDGDLVRVALDGDKSAFGLLVTRHRPLVLAVCHRALRDRELAEDVTQEAILQAMQRLDRLRRPDRFGPWLAGIGLNLCYRLRRQRAREAWSWEALIGGRLLPEPVDPAPSVEDQVEAAALRDWVQDAVAGLPAGQRAAVRLHYLTGLTQAETAALLGIEPGAVKARLHKARANLRRSRLREAGVEPESRGGRTMVAMRVADVGRQTVADDGIPRHFVVLEEVAGSRGLAIWMGPPEATAIALHLEDVPFPRPMTYQLMSGLLTAVGGRLREVRIDRLEGEVFYAVAVLDGPSGASELDARPSDALNLALVMAAPILVAEEIVAKNGYERGDEPRSPVAGPVAGRAAIVAELERAWPPRRDVPSSESSDPEP